MESTLFLAGGFLLGCMHAMEPDHVATVSTLILRRQKLAETFCLALRWSVGHSLTLLALAVMFLALKEVFNHWDLSVAERCVGASMMVLGLWILYRQWVRPVSSNMESLHSPRAGWVLFGMGVLHGTAGSSSIIFLIPLTFSDSAGYVLGYVFLFSAGMVATMGLYSLVLNKLIWLKNFSLHVHRLRGVSAVLAIVIGFRLLAGTGPG
ncbi:MAG: hypothetical protein COV67_10135 [Nitrospinae bacterium CG11_big_fil_rev_8_21_14_0_20_56_8]|nr:MAG: hypothetical protein COV67_10135 [Nitrospinae bacterium CG11_big_fil_rev_8_21_14_0_20_56_8]